MGKCWANFEMAGLPSVEVSLGRRADGAVEVSILEAGLVTYLHQVMRLTPSQEWPHMPQFQRDSALFDQLKDSNDGVFNYRQYTHTTKRIIIHKRNGIILALDWVLL